MTKESCGLTIGQVAVHSGHPKDVVDDGENILRQVVANHLLF